MILGASVCLSAFALLMELKDLNAVEEEEGEVSVVVDRVKGEGKERPVLRVQRDQHTRTKGLRDSLLSSLRSTPLELFISHQS